MGKVVALGFIIYLIIGLLLINFSLNIFEIIFLNSIEKWVILIGGVLVIAGGINYLRASRNY